MADAQVVERVRQAYIDPIRSVLVVDDHFPQYDVDNPQGEVARARALWLACRSRGLLCEIDDGKDLVGGQKAEHLLKSDLLVLDYHLENEDPKWALDLLSRLAASDHASLVVVYTKDPDILRVRRTIAAHLRGGIPRVAWFSSQEHSDKWDAIADKVNYRPTDDLIDAYLASDRAKYMADRGLREAMTPHGIQGKPLAEFARAIYESELKRVYPGLKQAEAGAVPPMLGGAGGGGVPPWVFVNNLFVACIQKTAQNEANGAVVFDGLEKALVDWNPNFLLSAAAFARGEFARGGFRVEREALADPNLQAGWLFHAWGGSEQDKEERLKSLFQRTITTYASRVLKRVIDFGVKHVPVCGKPSQSHDSLVDAIKEMKASRTPLEVLHQLNEYLVVEDHGPYVDTGTIFAIESDDLDGQEVFVYVCVTPSCDLVPRSPRVGSWESRIHPARQVVAIRAQLYTATYTHLNSAEEARCVFLKVGDKQKTLMLIADGSSVPILEWFFLENLGKIATDRTVEAAQVDRPAAAAAAAAGAQASAVAPLATKGFRLRILGQIRALYASRILQYAGQHLSRIGVDFVNLPVDPKLNKPNGPKK
jgi:hypothetical protein